MPLTRRIRNLVFRTFRKKRLERFLDAMPLTAEEVIVDVGGHPSTWTLLPQPCRRIDCVNLHEIRWDATQWPDHRIRLLIGDGCALPFENIGYGVAFSK